MNVDVSIDAGCDDSGGATTNDAASESGTEVMHKLEKKSFSLKNCNEDGILLTIHHTINDGEHKRIPFSAVCFNSFNDIIVTIDKRGNAFVFDLKSIEFWRLTNAVPCGAVVDFMPATRDIIFYGAADGTLSLLDLGTGTIITTEKILNGKIKHKLLIPSTSLLLCATSTECRLCRWSSTSIEPLQMLFDTTMHKTSSLKLAIKELRFLPEANEKTETPVFFKGRIIALLNDDSLHVWCVRNGSDTNDIGKYHWEYLTHLRLIELRDMYLQQRNAEAIPNAYLWSQAIDDRSRVKQFMTKLTSDYTRGLIGFVSLVNEGEMILGTCDGYLILLATDDWTVEMIYSVPGVEFSGGADCFSSERLDSSRKILDNVTSMFLNGNRMGFLKIGPDCACRAIGLMDRRRFVKAVRSINGKLLGAISDNGKAYIYDWYRVLDKLPLQMTGANGSYRDNELQTISQEIKNVLSPNRLKMTLGTYNEYPSKYRCIIWKRILQLPDNTKIYTELLKKGSHPSVEGIDQKFPLSDAAALRNLKKTLSCLAHWSKIFGQCIASELNQTANFLPAFVFPFIKLFANDTIGAFETTATILLNQCQLWFEFWPLLPINYLGIIENILSHFEPSLMKHLTAKSITSKIFAWKILRNLFTEVLADFQWYRLFDHVISNPPHFLLFAVVAYNIVQKRGIIRLASKRSVDKFFDEENVIEMRPFIEKIYWLMANCPRHLHPMKYMHRFEPLQSGQYQKMLNYPQTMVNVCNAQMGDLRMENQLLNRKLFELEKMERALIERLTKDSRQDEHERRLKTVEQLYAEAMLREEKRIAYQRKQLIMYHRQLNDRENEVLNAVQRSKQEKCVKRREDELNEFLLDLDRRKIREEADLILAEDNLRTQQMTLMVNQNETDNNDGCDEDTLAGKFRESLCSLYEQRQKLKKDIRKVLSLKILRKP